MHQDFQREISFVQGMLASNSQKDNLEHQVISRLLQVLDGCISEHQDMRLRLTELEEYVEAIDEDLDEMEQLLYEEDGFYSITCSDCGEEVVVDLDDLEDEKVELHCPQCHHLLIDVKEETQVTQEKELVGAK